MMFKPFSAVILTLSVLITSGQTEDKIFWQSDFGSNKTAFMAYGEDTQVEAVKDPSTKNEILKITYMDASSEEWCHRGVRIDFKKPVDWEDFEYVSAIYKVLPGATTVGFHLRDQDGNFWGAFQTRDIVSETWGISICPKSLFKFGYNEKDPEVTAPDRTAPITYMLIYFATLQVNTNTIYTAFLKDVTLSITPPNDDIDATTGASRSAATESTASGKKTGLIDNVTLSKAATAKSGGAKGEKESFPLQWKVDSMNANGFLVVDGKPFFPLGLYSCVGIDQASATYEICHYEGGTTDEINRARFQAIKDAGFNLLQTYTMNLYGQTVSRPGWKGAERSRFPAENGETSPELYREGMLKFMDYAEGVGLKVLAGAYSSYSINKNLPFTKREVEWDRRKKILTENMEAFKKHPALLVWYLIDEPSSVPMLPEDMALVYQHMKTLDTTHPIYMASADIRNDIEYFPDVDLVGPDTYPMAFNKPVTTDIRILDEFKKHQAGPDKMPKLWSIVQIAQWVKGTPLPTVKDMRLMSLLVLTRDIKGLMFYVHQNYPEKDPQHWANVSTVVNSLHKVTTDVANSTPVTAGYAIASSEINAMMRQVSIEGQPPHYQLIAVNANQDEALQPVPVGQVEITLDHKRFTKEPTVVAIDESDDGKFEPGKNRAIKLQKTSKGYVFADGFDGFASHVYRIDH